MFIATSVDRISSSARSAMSTLRPYGASILFASRTQGLLASLAAPWATGGRRSAAQEGITCPGTA